MRKYVHIFMYVFTSMTLRVNSRNVNIKKSIIKKLLLHFALGLIF